MCAAKLVALSGGTVAREVAVLDVYRRHKELKPEGIAELNEAGRKLARVLAEEVAEVVDELRRTADAAGRPPCLACSERKVGIVACSGEELAEGTVARLAALKVLHELRPGETVTICLPLFLAGGEGDRAFARFHPTITVDGCDLRCAAHGTEKYSGKPAASLVVDELVADAGLARPEGRRRRRGGQAGGRAGRRAARAAGRRAGRWRDARSHRVAAGPVQRRQGPGLGTDHEPHRTYHTDVRWTGSTGATWRWGTARR